MGLAVNGRGTGIVTTMALTRERWPNQNGLLDYIQTVGTCSHQKVTKSVSEARASGMLKLKAYSTHMKEGGPLAHLVLNFL